MMRFIGGSTVMGYDRPVDFYQMFDDNHFGVIVRQAVPDPDDIRDMRIIYANRFFIEIFGPDSEKTFGRGLETTFPDERERLGVLESFSKVIKSGESLTTEAYTQFVKKCFRIFSFSPARGYVVSIYEDITARKQLEEHLEEARNRSYHLTDSIDEVFWVRKKDKPLYVNPACEKILGLACSAFHKDFYSVLSVVHPDDYERIQSLLRKDGEDLETSINTEFRILDGTGAVRWIWLRTFRLKDYYDETQNKAASLIDITDKKRSDEKLSMEHKQVTILLDFYRNSSRFIELDDILQTTQRMLTEYVGTDLMAFLLFDQTSNTLSLRSVTDGIAIPAGIPEHISLSSGPLGQAILSRKPVLATSEAAMLKRFRDLIDAYDIETMGVFPVIFNETVLGVLVMFSQRSGPKLKNQHLDTISAICSQMAVLINNALLYEALKYELERRVSAEREVELLFNTALDFFVIMDEDGDIRRVSPGWVKKLGWDERDMLGKNLRQYIHPEDMDKALEQVPTLMGSGEVLNLEIRVLCGYGSYRWLAWNAHMACDGNHNLVIAVGRDITLHKEMEEKNRELEKAMQMEAVKMEFFANISHEFRTPLNIILSALQLITQSTSQSPEIPNHHKAMRHINSIKQNSFRLLRLVNNLIDMTKLDTGYFKIYRHNNDIVATIENITQSVAQYIEGKGLSLIFDTDVEEKVLACDSEMMERIMLNLLSNAVKFTDKGGYIKVTIQDKGDRVRISVRDNGIGIPEDKREAIFERFIQGDKQFTRRHEGSGIGLALVKSLVELHGGTIGVSSAAGKGSDFIFELPALVLEQDEEAFKNLEPTHEERIHKINVEFSDIYSLNTR